MFEIKGSHGTCRSIGLNIMKRGFILGNVGGMAGKGVYFWCQGRYNQLLAYGWYKYRQDKGDYDAEKDPRSFIIYAKLQCEDKCLLDMESNHLKELIDDLADKLGVEKNSYWKVSKLYDIFISKMESDRDQKFRIILKKLPPPPEDYGKDYPITIWGAPLCSIVLDTRCISIIDYKEV